jgi:hypothetical protein
MKTSIITLALIFGISAAQAQDFDVSAGLAYKPTLSQPAIDYVNREAEAHALSTWEGVRDAGGCNADFIPYEIAAYCWNRSVNAYPPEGAIGGAGGSDGGSSGGDGAE